MKINRKPEAKQTINNILACHEEELAGIRFPSQKRVVAALAKSIALLRGAGIDPATIALFGKASEHE